MLISKFFGSFLLICAEGCLPKGEEIVAPGNKACCLMQQKHPQRPGTRTLRMERVAAALCGPAARVCVLVFFSQLGLVLLDEGLLDIVRNELVA